MLDYARVAVRILSQPRYQHLIANTHAGQYGCTSCGHIGAAETFAKMTCPECHAAVRRHGCFDGNLHLRVKRTAKA
jgi:predicted RNA-binding Zn-ribbon protein involved in translation (DUF1610 family)